MRARLTLSFVVLTILLLIGALWVRGFTEYSVQRTHESRELRGEVAELALLIDQHQQLGGPVDRAYLAGLVDSSDRLAYDTGSGSPIVVEGKGYDGANADDALEASVDLSHGTVTLTQAGSVLGGLTAPDQGRLGFLILFLALVAALVGYVLSRVLSAPFRQLADAAGQLGRGRFDLDLPRTRIPEAKAVSQALQTSAGQLQERLATEQAFAQHASHVLRTPMTGLRLELEEVAERDDVPPDVREAVNRSLGRIQAMDAVAGDLVALARRGALVAGAEITLRDLATQSAQTWADALAEQARTVTAAVEGSLDMTYTPGPVEHILDLLLADVLKRGEGAVRMEFEADEEGHLSIKLSCAGLRSVSGPNAGVAVTQARAVVTALGGRLTGETPDQLAILLPRR